MIQYINLHQTNLLGNQKQNVRLNMSCHINIKIHYIDLKLSTMLENVVDDRHFINAVFVTFY